MVKNILSTDEICKSPKTKGTASILEDPDITQREVDAFQCKTNMKEWNSLTKSTGDNSKDIHADTVSSVGNDNMKNWCNEDAKMPNFILGAFK